MVAGVETGEISQRLGLSKDAFDVVSECYKAIVVDLKGYVHGVTRVFSTEDDITVVYDALTAHLEPDDTWDISVVEERDTHDYIEIAHQTTSETLSINIDSSFMYSDAVDIQIILH